MSAQWDRLLSGGQAPVYLIHGEETFLTRSAMVWLRETVLAGVIEDFNLDRFDGRENFDAERVAQAARTLPMMADRRMVWVRNAEVVFGRSKDALKTLLAYVDQPDPSTVLVFQAMAKVKKNSALYKRIAKNGCVLENQVPRERELASWINQAARDRGRQIDRDAASMLIEAIGRDLASLDTAIDRLCLYREAPASITLEDVEANVPHNRARTVWELVDAVADRNVSLVMDRAHQLLDQGEQPIYLLSLVVRQFRQLLIGASVEANGGSSSEAARAAGVPSFRESTFSRQLNNYGSEELNRAIHRMMLADLALKGSKMQPRLIFEETLLDLCAPR